MVPDHHHHHRHAVRTPNNDERRGLNMDSNVLSEAPIGYVIYRMEGMSCLFVDRYFRIQHI